MKVIYSLVLLSMLICCKDEDVVFLPQVGQAPIVDGLQEDLWLKTQPHSLFFYYGQKAEDSLDFSATYRVVQHNENMFFLVSVYDQIKYTHQKPTERHDLELWNPAHYDRVNLEFLREDNDADKFAINLNYGLDSVFTTNISPTDFKAIVSDTPLGYNVEFMIPLRLIRSDIITFNLWITDHDKRFHREGLDVFGVQESTYGSGGRYRKILSQEE